MIIHKIPKPITLIGEYSNKCICFSSCNFTYISNIGIKNKFLLNKNIKEFCKNYLKNFKNLKSNIIKQEIEGDFFSYFTTLFGNFNCITKFNSSWSNLKINYNKEFFENILIYHIRKKYFKYKKIKNEKSFNVDVVNKMVEDFYKAYHQNDIKFIGQLIDSYWRIKKQSDFGCADNYIYNLYSNCRLSGALGGKLDENTMVLIAPKEKHASIDNVMKDHIKLNSLLNTTGIITEEIFSGNSNCCK